MAATLPPGALLCASREELTLTVSSDKDVPLAFAAWGWGFFGLSLISSSLPSPGRSWSLENCWDWRLGWFFALVVRCGAHSTVLSHQRRLSACLAAASWLGRSGGRLFFSLVLDRTMLTCEAGKRNRQLFFSEQLESGRGGESLRDPS